MLTEGRCTQPTAFRDQHSRQETGNWLQVDSRRIRTGAGGRNIGRGHHRISSLLGVRLAGSISSFLRNVKGDGDKGIPEWVPQALVI